MLRQKPFSLICIAFVSGLTGAWLLFSLTIGDNTMAVANDHPHNDDKPHVTKVRELHLIDGNGTVRAILGFDEGVLGLMPQPSLRFVGVGGATQLRIGFDEMGVGGAEPTIQMANLEGKVMARAFVTPPDVFTMDVSGAKGNSVELRITEGGPHFWMRGENGRIFATITEGDTSLDLRHSNGGRVLISVGPDQHPTVKIMDEQGKTIGSIP